ncbi:MAG TPA: hypothetical protein VJ179_03960 [Patescibacteria group bacterium]|nr:hypothetical protein [Patescibacteria group bacterium]
MNKLKFLSKRTILIALAVIVFLAVSYAVVQKVRSNATTSKNGVYSKIVKVNQSFEFAAKDERGNGTDKKVKMTLVTAEQTNSILVKGKKLKAKSDKMFTIVLLEIENPHQERLTLAPFELMRLIDSQGKIFAPDVHNAVVTLQPISTKRDRVGFLLDSKEKTVKLQIGEITGDKKVIQVKF